MTESSPIWPKVSERGVFCTRTLNLRSIRAVGYDMDYTLIHYHVEEWERRAYQHIKERLLANKWPVDPLHFDPLMVCRGLIIDRENGNLLKTNRFGFVKRAMHGTQPMDFEIQRKMYSRTIVDLSERRWIFLNTLFSLSEGCLYAQLVDLLDRREIPEVLGYADLYERVKGILDAAHLEGRLKAEIISNPERFVVLDPETPLTLLDQHFAGKKLVLITNSEWSYTSAMMAYSFNRFMPHGLKWQDLFDLIIVGARKPDFFTGHSHPIFEVVTDDGLLKPTTGRLIKGKSYLGGSADLVERNLNLSGDEILYVGDHMFGDVHVSKNVLRWRTALVLRELEDEIRATSSFRPEEGQLATLMGRKETIEEQICRLRVELQRDNQNYGPKIQSNEDQIQEHLNSLRAEYERLDEQVAPLAKKATELNNPHWGLIMRAGNDKSYLAYQVERYADIYMSRVSNLLSVTPFAYLRSSRGTLPHDLIIASAEASP